jgi:hypothetical protein
MSLREMRSEKSDRTVRAEESAPLGMLEKELTPVLWGSVLGLETDGLVFTGRESNELVAVAVFRLLRELKTFCEGVDGAEAVGTVRAGDS